MPRHRHVLVFAETISEANTYAKRAGLPRGAYRAVGHAGSIRGIQVADIHELPGFENRRDKHAIRAAVRHGRDIRHFHVEMPPKPDAPVVDQGDGMGQQLTIGDILADQAAHAEFVSRRRELLEPVSNALETPEVVDEPVETVTIPITPSSAPPREFDFKREPVEPEAPIKKSRARKPVLPSTEDF